MKNKEIEEIFGGILEKEQDVSAGMAAIRTLLTVLERDMSETVQELDSNLQAAVDAMKKTDYPVTAVASGCELFLRFITLAKLDTKTFEECKSIMLHRGQLFLSKLKEARGKVAKLASAFIVDGSRVLTHSKSRVVLQAMKEAARANKRFEVYISISSPDSSGKDMCRLLEKENIPCTVILDSAVGYVMEQVDMVMVGAEGVVESGGIINKVGSYTMAMCARELKKPFYVLTESFKFVRLYPLNQHDLPDEFKKPKNFGNGKKEMLEDDDGGGDGAAVHTGKKDVRRKLNFDDLDSASLAEVQTSTTSSQMETSESPPTDQIIVTTAASGLEMAEDSEISDVFSSDDSLQDPDYQPQPDEENLLRGSEVLNTRSTNTTKSNRGMSRIIRQNRKKSRNTGKSYVTESGKHVSERSFIRLTGCRLNCKDKISEERQKNLFEAYWKMGLRDRRSSYLSGLINFNSPKVSRKRRMTPEKRNNRQVTYQYHVPVDGENIKVCKSCFLKVFNETPKFLWILCQQKLKSPGDTVTPDKRGKHSPPNKISQYRIQKVHTFLNSLPLYESHYCRQESSKKYLPPYMTLAEVYRKYRDQEQSPVGYTVFTHIFHSMNIAIKNPKKDTCHTCDAIKMKLTHALGEEKADLIKLQENHHREAELAYQTKIKDKMLAKENDHMTVLVFDLQQCLPTPSLQTSIAFYKRQLWTFNLTVRNLKNDNTSCFLWYETLAKRGANEISSCVSKAISNLPENIDHAVLYSDSCSGQNKNTPFLAMCVSVMNKTNIKILDHKFLVPGHSRMECDSDHGKIEKLKKRYHMPISHPHDWAQLIRLAGKKYPFEVIELIQEDFLDYSALSKTQMQMKKFNEEGDKFVWRSVKWLRYVRNEPLKLFYKTSLKEEDRFCVMDLSRRQNRQPCLIPQVCYNARLPISAEKKRDLLSLLPYVTPVFHEFYKSLPSSGNVKDPILDSEDDD